MNWDALGAIAETIGAVGIIFTLFYLARQIRNSVEEQSTTHAQGAIQQLFEMAQNDETYVPLLLKMSQGQDLTAQETAYVVTQLTMFMKGYEVIWLQHSRGALLPETYNSLGHMIQYTLSPAAALSLWDETKGVYDTGFTDYVDSIVSSEGPGVLASVITKRVESSEFPTKPADA